MLLQRRQRVYLDRVQSVLVLRVVAYWFYCLLAATLMACCLVAWLDPPASAGELFAQVFRRFGLVYAASIAVLPLVMLDVVRISHRFVGPIFRLRQALRQAADGGAVEPIKFRDDDYWREVADEFNRAFAARRAAE